MGGLVGLMVGGATVGRKVYGWWMGEWMVSGWVDLMVGGWGQCWVDGWEEGVWLVDG